MDTKNKTWNQILVAIIKEANKPLTRKEIFEIVKNDLGFINSPLTFGVYLFNAKKAGVIASVKVPPSRTGFYCNPDWLDENGELIEQYKFIPFW